MRSQRAIVILAVSVLIVLPMLVMFAWLSSRPAWRLSARNSAEGVIVEVYKEHENEPTYSTLLKGRAIPQDVERVTIQKLPSDVGTTTFSDETIRPGRWTLVVGGTELDIMPRALIVDGDIEIPPNE